MATSGCVFSGVVDSMSEFREYFKDSNFATQEEFDMKFSEFQKRTGTCFVHRSSVSRMDRIRKTGKDIPESFSYYWVRYVCVHNGRKRPRVPLKSR